MERSTGSTTRSNRTVYLTSDCRYVQGLSKDYKECYGALWVLTIDHLLGDTATRVPATIHGSWEGCERHLFPDNYIFSQEVYDYVTFTYIWHE